MRSSHYYAVVGALMSAAGAIPFLSADWAGLIVVCGLGLVLAGVKAAERERAVSRQRSYDVEYAPAVRRLLRLLLEAYRRSSEDKNATKTDLLGLGGTQLITFSEQLYAPGFLNEKEDEGLFDDRKTLGRFYQEWSHSLPGSAGYRRWLANIQRDHVPVFRLWLHLHEGLATVEKLDAPNFRPYEVLAEHWGIELPRTGLFASSDRS